MVLSQNPMDFSSFFFIIHNSARKPHSFVGSRPYVEYLVLGLIVQYIEFVELAFSKHLDS